MCFSGRQLKDEDTISLRTDMSSLQTDMSVAVERVVAPHGWLRYDVERIRSVRHLTDPEHRPGPGVRPRGVWILCEALSGLEAQQGVELHE